MTPARITILLIALSLAAWIGHEIVASRRRRAIERLARAHRLQFSSRDLFKLHLRIGGILPIVGAADVRVADLVYGLSATGLRYVFTAEFTTGATVGKRRHRVVAELNECKEPTDSTDRVPTPRLRFAQRKLDVVDQYNELLSEAAPANSKVA